MHEVSAASPYVNPGGPEGPHFSYVPLNRSQRKETLPPKDKEGLYRLVSAWRAMPVALWSGAREVVNVSLDHRVVEVVCPPISSPKDRDGKNRYRKGLAK